MIESMVYNLVSERGYGKGDLTDLEYVNRQVLKALEELGEVARHIFDGNLPPREEIADVAIPLLCICGVLDYNFTVVVLNKAANDINRGVRKDTKNDSTK